MLLITSITTIFITMILVTNVYYNLFCKKAMEEIHLYAVLMQDVEQKEASNEFISSLQDAGLRLTMIDHEGKVLFDSEMDVDKMESHQQRPEVMDAISVGEGEAVRYSDTLSSVMFYYAVRMNNGNILRFSRKFIDFYTFLGEALPGILVVLVCVFLVSMILSHIFASRLIQPIKKIADNLEQGGDFSEYEELRPFIKVIEEQHHDIMKNAMVRQEFTANVSHELKTPLTSISGYAELIETGIASEEDVTRFAHGIHSSSKRLLTLINDVIRLSELDSVNEDVVFEKLNLYELAETCVEMLTLNAEKHGVKIFIRGDVCYLKGNKQMIEELLYNLCDNAIRYNNEDGIVEVKVFTEGKRVVLEVEDTGIGIPKEHQERIFERFYRVDKSRSKSTGGTGLGLAIVKHILVRHNAEMELISEVGKGTKIRVIF